MMGPTGYNSHEEVIPHMATEEYMQRMLDRLDQDMRDHKQEMRDRDARLQADAQEREARYRTESKEREDRYRAEMKEREDRLIKTIDDGFKTQKEILETKLDTMDVKIDHIERQTDIRRFWVSVIATVVITAAAGAAGVLATLHSAQPPISTTSQIK